MTSPVQMPVLVSASTDDSHYRLVASDWSIDFWRYRFTIKSGFVTDGASVPKLLHRVAGRPFDAPRVAAAVVHDWLYTSHVTSRLFADLVFLGLMIRVGYPTWRALTDFWAVRRFGQSAWDFHNDPIQVFYARACGCMSTNSRKEY